MSTKPGLHIDSAEAFLAASGGQFDLLALLAVVLRAKQFVLLTGLACGLVVWLFLWHVPTTYKAAVEIVPPQVSRGSSTASMLSQSGLLGDSSGLSGLSSALQTKTQSDLFVIILAAWPLQDGLVKRFDLVTVYHATNATQARRILASRTTIKAAKEGVINVSVVDLDRKRSAQLANGYVDEGRTFLRGLALSEAAQRRVFYEAQLARTKDDLASAESKFSQMQQNSGMVSLDSQAKALLEGAAELRAQITAKEVELESLRGYSTEANPQVQILESEVTALRGQLVRLESHGQGGFTGRSLNSVPGSELAFVRATRELKYQEGLYDLMVRQYEGSRIDEARDAPVIQVIEPALVPDRKFGPNRLQDTLGGLGLGLLLGVFVTVIRYWRSRLDARGVARIAELRRAALRWSA